MSPPPLEPYSTDIRHFVRFDPDGRIRGAGRMAVGFIVDEIEGVGLPGPNPYLILGEATFDPTITGYREYVREHEGSWFVEARPALTETFDRLALAPGEEARIAALPAARVRFMGPVRGEVEHPGGIFEIGWTVPGDYEVTIEAWPCLPTRFQFKVT